MKPIYCPKYCSCVLLGMVCLLLVSCGPRRTSSECTVERKAQVEAEVKAATGIDSLKMLIKSYERDGNGYGVAYAYLILGKSLREHSLFSEAIEVHRKGIEAACDIEDTLLVVQGYNNIGTNFRRMGILDEASSNHYKALEYAQTYSDSVGETARKNKVVSLNGIGNVYLTLKNFEAADSVFRIALRGEHELGSALGQAINCANIGSIKESLGNVDSARVYYSLSMNFNREANSDLGISLCHVSFGRLFEKEGKYAEAIAEYRKAFQLMESKGDSWHWMESCLALARIFITMGDLHEAGVYLGKASRTATQIHSLEFLEEVEFLYYRYFEKLGDSRNALNHFVASRAYADSVTNGKNQEHLQKVRLQYERVQKQHEMAGIRATFAKERQVKNQILIGVGGSLLVCLALVAFLWYALRLRARSQSIMRKAEKIRTDFFTNVTHEFRTPLTVILGLNRELRQEPALPFHRQVEICEIIERQGNALLELINQLLDISKVRSAIGEPQWRTGDAVAYLRMVVESNQSIAMQKRVGLTYTPAETCVVMDFVPDYMLKIVRNLLSNALKYTPAYGKVSVTSGTKGDCFIIKVADTGCGISADDLPHIFEPFYQGGNSERKLSTGIGLSLVSQLVMSMGGSIKADSTLRHGSRFTVCIPLRHGNTGWQEAILPTDDSEALAMDVPVDTFAVEADDIRQGDGSSMPVLLVVEDNADICYYIGSLLEGKYRLFFARNGSEGVDKAMELMPDLILTDVMMPEMDGFELCKAVRASDILNHIPIIITAKDTEEDRIRGLEAGADAYLYKPFNVDELNVRVGKLLESRRMLCRKYGRAVMEDREAEVRLSDKDAEFIDRLRRVIDAQMKNSDTDTGAVAEKMFMSRSQLGRKIQSVTGLAPSAYILQVRLHKAKQMLDADAGITIGEVADACGFGDCSYFTRVFKRQYQVTPSAYRKRK